MTQTSATEWADPKTLASFVDIHECMATFAEVQGSPSCLPAGSKTKMALKKY